MPSLTAKESREPSKPKRHLLTPEEKLEVQKTIQGWIDEVQELTPEDSATVKALKGFQSRPSKTALRKAKTHYSGWFFVSRRRILEEIGHLHFLTRRFNNLDTEPVQATTYDGYVWGKWAAHILGISPSFLSRNCKIFPPDKTVLGYERRVAICLYDPLKLIRYMHLPEVEKARARLERRRNPPPPLSAFERVARDKDPFKVPRGKRKKSR